MSTNVWKEFEENQLSHSAAHYLMTIHALLDEFGYARVTDIAKQLNITRGSCSISLKPLKRRGLVVEDENRFLKLSDEGLRMAQLVARNDELLEIFFRDVLGVEQEQAEIDACKIEHLLSIESSIRLAAFIEHIQSGSDTTDAFLQTIRQDAVACEHDSKKCSLCDEVCFAEGQLE
jgi:DtxR family Mn-dependent transcriptional regulator